MASPAERTACLSARLASQQRTVHPFVVPPALATGGNESLAILIVGAGPVGLTLAIDLRLRGLPVVIVEEDDQVGAGSRAICWSKRTLEIFDRLGVAAPIVARGITWNRGKVFFRDRLAYAFDLLPEGGHAFPAFVNLQQHIVEEILVARALEVGVEIRWQTSVSNVEASASEARVAVETPAGSYTIVVRWLVAADGVRSRVRRALGLDFRGQVFRDHFLIADVRMRASFPTERWFWFDPPFHRGGSALLHRQADDVWRLDFQLGPDADPEEERKPERVLPRIRAMLGPGVDFDLDWVSVYTFQCRRLDRFVHGPVLFAGDAAHTVSPFGARGGNGGVQDADNLGWKLVAVEAGAAPRRLVESYDEERVPAADENIRHSTRSTDFITPKSSGSAVLREAVLSLAERHPFARRVVNSGRLSTPHVATRSPLVTADVDAWSGGLAPGTPAADAPIEIDGRRSSLLHALPPGFVALAFTDRHGRLLGAADAALDALAGRGLAVIRLRPADAESRAGHLDVERSVADRYGAAAGTIYLLRPDQHVSARWRNVEDAERIQGAVARALARETA